MTNTKMEQRLNDLECRLKIFEESYQKENEVWKRISKILTDNLKKLKEQNNEKM